MFARSQKIGPLPPTANPYPSRFQEFRRRVSRYGALLLIALLLSTMFFPNMRERFIGSSLDGVASLVSVAQAPVEFIRDTVRDAKSLSTLKREVIVLQKQLRDMKQKSVFYNQIKFENEVLRRYLNVPQREGVKFYTAPLVAVPKGGISHSLLILLGSKDGVAKGQGVVSDQGAVGRLNIVGGDSARVRLLTDSNSRIPVYLPRIEEKGILAGNGTNSPTLVYVHEVDSIKEGDEIITSGLGGVFPHGIPVGRVNKVSNGIVSVTLSSNPASSYYLQVLEMVELDPIVAEDVTSE